MSKVSKQLKRSTRDVKKATVDQVVDALVNTSENIGNLWDANVANPIDKGITNLGENIGNLWDVNVADPINQGTKNLGENIDKIFHSEGDGSSSGSGSAAVSPTTPDETKLTELGLNEKGQIEDLSAKHKAMIDTFAKEFGVSAKELRARLAQRLSESKQSILTQLGDIDKQTRERLAGNLASMGQQTFERANPFILEDLNRRGLFTSESAVTGAQADALKDIALANQAQLTNYDVGQASELADTIENIERENTGSLANLDTDFFKQEEAIKSGGLDKLIGGEESALTAALEARRAGVQRSFDLADADREERLARYLAKKQSRNQIVSSLIGLTGTIGGAVFGGPMGAAVGSQIGQQVGNAVAPDPLTATPGRYSVSRRPYGQPGGTLGPVDSRYSFGYF